MKKTIVLKIGSSTLTGKTKIISRGKIEDLARQIIALQKDFQFIIVSSGAIATARQFIDIQVGNDIAIKQALAAIGQPALMKIYQEGFADFGLKTAQCLLHYRDFENEKSKQNIVNAVNILLQNDFIPIINENDTVSTAEIRFGDNDKLSAQVAALMKVDLLILASDINGLYDKDPNKHSDAEIIPLVNEVATVKHLGGASSSDLGTGGMETKLLAAEICEQAGIEMWILNGGQSNFVVEALEGKVDFTRFKRTV